MKITSTESNTVVEERKVPANGPDNFLMWLESYGAVDDVIYTEIGLIRSVSIVGADLNALPGDTVIREKTPGGQSVFKVVAQERD